MPSLHVCFIFLAVNPWTPCEIVNCINISFFELLYLFKMEMYFTAGKGEVMPLVIGADEAGTSRGRMTAYAFFVQVSNWTLPKFNIQPDM